VCVQRACRLPRVFGLGVGTATCRRHGRVSGASQFQTGPHMQLILIERRPAAGAHIVCYLSAPTRRAAKPPFACLQASPPCHESSAPPAKVGSVCGRAATERCVATSDRTRRHQLPLSNSRCSIERSRSQETAARQEIKCAAEPQQNAGERRAAASGAALTGRAVVRSGRTCDNLHARSVFVDHNKAPSASGVAIEPGLLRCRVVATPQVEQVQSVENRERSARAAAVVLGGHCRVSAV
jgi:hypothetical protein